MISWREYMDKGSLFNEALIGENQKITVYQIAPGRDFEMWYAVDYVCIFTDFHLKAKTYETARREAIYKVNKFIEEHETYWRKLRCELKKEIAK